MFLGRVSTGELAQVYRELLQRESDASGVATYTGSGAFADALTVDQLRGIIKGSAEYAQKAALLDPEFAKTQALKNQLIKQRDFLKLTYQGAMPDAWLLDHLVFLLREVGITDIRQLAVRQKSYDQLTYGTNQVSGEANKQTIYYPEYYHRDTGFVISGTSLAHPPMGQEGDNVWAVNYEGKGGTRFHVQYVGDVPIFYTSYKATNFFETHAQLIQIIGMMASFAGLPPMIGKAITNTLGIAASAATQKIIGQIAMSTALSGGNIENAVTSAALNVIGGEVGDYVRTASDSNVLGIVADASATAALTGGDIQQAIASELASAGLSKGVNVLRQNTSEVDFSIDSDTSNFAYDDVITDFNTTDALDTYFADLYATDDNVGLTALDDYSQLTLSDLGIDADPIELSDAIAANFDELESLGLDVSGVLPDDNGNLFLYTGEVVEFTFDDYVNNYFVGEDGALYNPYGGEVLNATDMLAADTETIALAIDSDVRATQNTVQTTNANVARPDTVAAVTNSGRVPAVDNLSIFERVGNMAIKLYSTFKVGTQAFATGTGIYRPQAVGVPVKLADGSTVINNGDGTVTRRYLDGTVTTVASQTGSGLFGGLSTNTLLLGGAVIVGALLLSRRK